VNIQIDILLKKNVQSCKLIKKVEVFKVWLILLTMRKTQRTKDMKAKAQINKIMMKLKEFKVVTLQIHTIDKAMPLKMRMTRKKLT
jgi:uncharacterized membrane protein